MRLQNNNHQTEGFSTFPTVITTGGAFAVLALIALIFTNGESSLLVKSLAILLAGTVGAFLSFIVSQFKFSGYRHYNRVEITDEDSVSDKVALEFNVRETKKQDIEKVLEIFDPVEVNFSL